MIIFDSSNSLPPVQWQVITWTNVDSSEIWIKVQTFASKKMHLTMSTKYRHFVQASMHLWCRMKIRMKWSECVFSDNQMASFVCGLLKLCSLISPLPVVKFWFCKKYLYCSFNHFHIWRVSPQLSCGETSQIWTKRDIQQETSVFKTVKNRIAEWRKLV